MTAPSEPPGASRSPKGGRGAFFTGMVTFTIPIPPSLKNNARIGVVFGRAQMRKSKEVTDAKRSIGIMAREAATKAGVKDFGDRDVGAEMTHNVSDDTLTVLLWDRGPRPKGKTGRKYDLQNMQDTVFDALEGVLYDNDNQITLLHMERNL